MKYKVCMWGYARSGMTMFFFGRPRRVFGALDNPPMTKAFMREEAKAIRILKMSETKAERFRVTIERETQP